MRDTLTDLAYPSIHSAQASDESYIFRIWTSSWRSTTSLFLPLKPKALSSQQQPSGFNMVRRPNILEEKQVSLGLMYGFRKICRYIAIRYINLAFVTSNGSFHVVDQSQSIVICLFQRAIRWTCGDSVSVI